MLLACIDDSDASNKRYNIRVKDIELITGRKMELPTITGVKRRDDV